MKKFSLSLFIVLGFACGSSGLIVAHAAADDKCLEATRLVNLGLSRADASPEEEKLYRDAAAACPSLVEAHFNLGVLFLKQNRPQQALEPLRSALGMRDSSTIRIALATAEASAGNLDAAENEFSKIRETEPLNIKALQGLSVVYEKKGDSIKAMETLKRAIEIDRSDAAIHFNLGALLEKSGQLSEALDAYVTASRLDSQNFDAAFYQGLLYSRLGRFGEAAAALGAASRINPESVEALIALGMTQEKLQDFEKAELALRKAVSIEPKNNFAKINLAVVLVRKNQESLAEDVLKTVVLDEAQNAKAHAVLGWARLELGKLKDAEQSLKKALEIDPANVIARNNLAVLYQRQGKKEEAKAELDLAIHSGTDLPEARANRDSLSEDFSVQKK